MEVTKFKWFELQINASYQDEFEEACEELDIKFEYISSDELSNSIYVNVGVINPEEMFYLGQWYEAKK